MSRLLTLQTWHSWPQLSGDASARSKLVVGPSLPLVLGLPLVVGLGPPAPPQVPMEALVVGLLVMGPPPQVPMEALVVGLLVVGPPAQVPMEALPVVALPVGHAWLCTKQSSLAHTSCAETKLLVAPRQSLLGPVQQMSTV